LVGDYAYVADSDSGLRIISLADPARPAEVGSVYCDAAGVAVNSGLAYVGCEDSSFRVISVSDPANPVEVGRLDSVLWAWGTQSVGLARGFAFVTNWTSGLQACGLWVVSVTDSSRPVLTAYYRLGSCWSTALSGSYFYVSTNDGLNVLQFYQLGDLDIDDDSLDVVADTLWLRRWEVAGLGHDPESPSRFRSCPRPYEVCVICVCPWCTNAGLRKGAAGWGPPLRVVLPVG
jgi:hypothetical protein